jgi:filamentous hemagglutinin family protein
MMERSLPRPTQTLWRAAMLATTGLSALGIAAPAARAQTALPADTTPQGGQVAAGSAAITQGNASTTINQASQSTIINWQSFNVGSAAKVQFNQPSSSAIALNRVMTPSPSLIAGQITANGQLVIINQSGVVFAKGSEVNAESLVVATSNIADKDFMAGRMNFSGAPNPGAKIINDGNITVKDTGLVGLVAPQVENNGIITARLGQAVLAGASAFTLDLYGDRLISIDVTKAVRAVDLGGQTVAALVTNRGLILANGGTITLTAQDADALVTQLVDAGGTLQANSAGAQAGAINLSGVGGNISIAGNLLARGANAGEKGGVIQALTTGTLSLGATAVVDASGAAGGGVVALGTDLTRATQGPSDKAAPKAAAVLVAAGASIASNATDHGDGGRITILSAQQTNDAGAISATGGPKGGNGGFAEISGDTGYALTGTVNVAAAKGAPGTILIDPTSLTIASGGTTALTTQGSGGTLSGGGGNATLAAGEFTSLTGNVELLASSGISVDEAIISSTLESLLLKAPAVITDAAGTISLTGTEARLSVVADTLSFGAPAAAATIEIAPYTSGSAQTIFAGEAGSLDASSLLRLGAYTPYAAAGSPTPAISITAGSLDFATGTGTVNAPGALALESTGTIGQAIGGLELNTGTLAIGAGTSVTLGGAANVIGTLVSAATTNGLAVTDSGGLFTFGPIKDTTSISLTAADLTNQGTLSAPEISLQAAAGSIGNFGLITAANSLALDTSGNIALLGGTLAAPFISLASDGLNITGTLDAATLLALAINGSIYESGNGAVNAGTLLTTTPITGGLTLAGDANHIAVLNAAADGLVDIIDQGPVAAIQGSLTGASVFLTAPTISMVGFGQSIVSASGGTVALGTNGYLLSANSAILAPAGTIEIAPLTPGALLVSQPLADLFDPNAKEVVLGNGVAGTQAAEIFLSGSVSFSTGTLVDLSTTGVIDQTAGTLSTGTLAFDSGGFVQNPTAAIDATLFEGDGGAITGDVTLPGTANAVGTLGAMALGPNTLNLNDNRGLFIYGPLTAGALTLAADFLTLDGDLSATGAMDLVSGGDVFQNTGSISAGTLTGSARDDAIFTDAFNNVQTLGNFTLPDFAGTGGEFVLNDAAPLSIPGTLIATTADISATEIALSGGITLFGDLDLQSTDSIALGGAIDAGGAVSLQAPGSITGSGAITAATLTSGGALDGNLSLTGANQIGTIAGFSTTDDFDLANAGPLAIAGSGITAGNDITLVAPTLGLNAPLSANPATGDVALAADLFTFGSAAPVTADIISLAPYTGGKTLDFGPSLTGDANIPFADIVSLTAPTLEIGNAAGHFAASLVTGGSLSFPGALILNATGGVSQTGTLTAANLIINAASIALGGAAGAATLALNAVAAVTDTGTLSADTILLDAGSFSQAPGAAPITAAALQGNLDSGGTFANLGNRIATLGPLTVASGRIDLADDVLLTVDAPVAATGITLTDAGPGIYLGSAGSLAALSAGTIALTTDSLNVADGATLSGGLGIIDPYSGTAIDLGGTSASALDLAQSVFTAAGSLSVLQIGQGASPISADSPITATNGTLLLDGDGIVLHSALTATGALALQSPAGVSETSGGSITAPVVTGLGTFANILLTSNANSIASLGNFAVAPGGTLALDNSGTLTVTGAIIGATARYVSLTSGEIFVPGTVTGPDLLYLGANDSIGITGSLSAGALVLNLATGQASESGNAAITAATLAAGPVFGGDLLFGSAHNSIGTLAGFSATQFLLDDRGPLDVTGPLTAVNATLAAGALALNAPVSIANTLNIDSYGGGISQSAAITAATLTNAGSLGGGNVALTNPGNRIATLGSFVLLGGDFALNDVTPLALAGPLTAGQASLDAPGIAITGAVDIGGALGLASTGTIAESGAGGITAGTLSSGPGGIGGGLILGGANQIGTLGNLAIPSGTLDLADGQSLSVAGNVTAHDASVSAPTLDLTGSITTTDALNLSSRGAITLAGLADAGTGLTLASTSGVTETSAGTLATPLLTGTNLAGTVALNNPDNRIGALGDYDFGPALQLTDGAPLVIAGDVFGSTAELSANSMTLASTGNINTAFGLTLDGQEADGSDLELDGVIAAGPRLSLQNFDTIAEPAGTITATELDSGSGADGQVVLNNGLPIQNFIGTLGHFSANNLNMIDQQALKVTGSVAVDSAFILAFGINFDGFVSVTNALQLSSIDAITQSGGTIAAGALQSDAYYIDSTPEYANGDTALNLPGNAILSLGPYGVAPGNNISVVDATSLAVNGPLSADAINLAADGIVFNDDVTSTRLTLASPAGITQSAGNITTDTLTSGAAGITGATSLADSTNSIATLASYADTGDLTLATAGALDIAGAVRAATLDLNTGADLTESGAGQVTATSLTTGTGEIAGNAQLTNALNQIGTLGNITTAGDLALVDARALNLTGALSLGSATLGAGTLSLTDAASVTQSAGSIDALLLSGSVTGSAAFAQPGNAIAQFGGFTAAGNITLDDATPLALTGNLSNPGQALTLADTAGDITQTAGALTTGVLNASAPDLYLGDANAIGAIGNVTAGGVAQITGVAAISGQLQAQDATLSSTGNFALGGASTLGGQLTITAGGALTQIGNVTAAGATYSADGISLAGHDNISGLLDLLSTGSIAQTGGNLAAGTLAGAGATNAAFGTQGAAEIGTLGSFILGDTHFILDNTGPLTVNGPVDANIISISATGLLTLDGANDGGLFTIAGGPTPDYKKYNVTEAGLAGSNYSVLTAPQITEINGFKLNTTIPVTAAPTAYFGTVFMITDANNAAGGDISFQGTDGGLLGTEIDLVIAAGTTGHVTGNVDLHHLEVISAELVDLSGTIDGIAGEAAAENGTALPNPQTKYQFNACPIGSVNCIILSIESLPTVNPLGNFDISQRKKRRLNKNVQLPGIATHDF